MVFRLTGDDTQIYLTKDTAGVPREPWDQAAHEQHDRAIEQGDPPAHPGRGQLPRLQQRAHARMRQNPLRHLTLVVGPAIHGHVPAR